MIGRIIVPVTGLTRNYEAQHWYPKGKGNESNENEISKKSNDKENVSNQDDKPDWLLAIEENKKRRAERKKERMMKLKEVDDDSMSNISNMVFYLFYLYKY